MIVVDGVGSQPSAERYLTTVPSFVKSPDANSIDLEHLSDGIALEVGEITEKSGFWLAPAGSKMPSTRNLASLMRIFLEFVEIYCCRLDPQF